MMVSFFVFIPVTAFDIEYVGLIDENLEAPTAIVVSGQSIAVLEPYQNQLKIFTHDGIITQKIDIESTGTGLVELSDGIYLYCDRKAHKVMAVDIRENRLYEYLPLNMEPVDPIDIKVNKNMIYILDAGTGTIMTYDKNDEKATRFLMSGKNLKSFLSRES